MSPRSTQERLEDILDAVQAIQAHRDEAEMANLAPGSRLLLDGVVRQLAIIGEAAAHLPDEVTARHTHLPWRGIKGMRLWLDHEYHRVDTDVVWTTVDEDLPALAAAVHAELGGASAT